MHRLRELGVGPVHWFHWWVFCYHSNVTGNCTHQVSDYSFQERLVYKFRYQCDIIECLATSAPYAVKSKRGNWVMVKERRECCLTANSVR